MTRAALALNHISILGIITILQIYRGYSRCRHRAVLAHTGDKVLELLGVKMRGRGSLRPLPGLGQTLLRLCVTLGQETGHVIQVLLRPLVLQTRDDLGMMLMTS